MKAKTARTAMAAAVAFVGGSGVWADSAPDVPYPADYRKWAVTRSFIAGPESPVAGFHHFYANDEALEGFMTGKFPDGAVIADERLEVEQAGGNSHEGKRLSLAVMTKDSRRYAETGGWGFDRISGEGTAPGAPADVRAQCYSCHSKQKDRDFVFSKFRK